MMMMMIIRNDGVSLSTSQDWKVNLPAGDIIIGSNIIIGGEIRQPIEILFSVSLRRD